MVIAVAGGTGALGRETVAALAARGHEVRTLSRRPPQVLPLGVDHRQIDLLTGDGLAVALDGADAVVNAADGGPGRRAATAVLLDGTRRLLAAVRSAGVEHHVGVSIVGVDRMTAGYHGVKAEQERLVRSGPVPWTIVRATQFHGLVARIFGTTARVGLLPGAAFPLQPVDVREVAEVLADTVEAGPSGEITQFAGPEIAAVRALAHAWRRETGRRALVAPVPLPGAIGRALADGALTNPGAWRGQVTFEAWLREQAGRAAAPAEVAGRHAPAR
jgi:uncharacterized protein YbjT (DUF2867 family)